VKAIAHVRMAEHLRFLQVEPCDRVERVCIRRRHAAVIGRRIPLDVEKLIERRLQLGGLGDV
jgi:hypothetical protein